eukprot:Amastigsp_a5615_29.p3 type:complete len:148 gc:universal Amastigsp_a5615_29:447-890(+)
MRAASSSPSSARTWRSEARSHMLPKIAIGVSQSLTRWISSTISRTASNDSREQSENTTKKPWLARWYESRKAENSSCPAGSKRRNLNFWFATLTLLSRSKSVEESMSATKASSAMRKATADRPTRSTPRIVTEKSCSIERRTSGRQI